MQKAEGGEQASNGQQEPARLRLRLWLSRSNTRSCVSLMHQAAHLMGSSCTIVTLWPRHEKASVGRCCGATAPALAQGAEAQQDAPGKHVRQPGQLTFRVPGWHDERRHLPNMRYPRDSVPGAAHGRLRMASFISSASASWPTAERSTWEKRVRQYMTCARLHGLPPSWLAGTANWSTRVEGALAALARHKTHAAHLE